MLTAQENERLTRTGPDTPMGAVFRQYWHPALLSRELLPDAPPKLVTILGETFAAFRDTNGRAGIVEPRCPHRGANLLYGRVEACGLRCIYHGWKFDVRGNCVDIPTAAPDVAERLKPRASVRALTTTEWCGMVWAHFGGDPPGVPQLDFADLPDEHWFVSKKLQQCNWAQAVEGGLDTAHFSFLHANIHEGTRAPLAPSQVADDPKIARYRWLIEDPRPAFTVLRHDAGLLLCAARKADNEQLYWRLTQFMMPNHSMVPNSFPGDNHQGNTWVPIDDESCWIYCYAYNPERPLTETERERYAAGLGIFAAVDENFVPIRNRNNNYLIDRDLQLHGNFTGIRGISEQDAAVADSQGLIADRTRELLGQTDLGIVRFRRMMLEAARLVAAGEIPPGRENADAYRVRSGDAMSDADSSAIDVARGRFGDLAGVDLRKSSD